MSRKLIAIIALLILAGGAAAVLLLKKPAETALQMPDAVGGVH
jgi:hypothetical protein